MTKREGPIMEEAPTATNGVDAGYEDDEEIVKLKAEFAKQASKIERLKAFMEDAGGQISIQVVGKQTSTNGENNDNNKGDIGKESASRDGYEDEQKIAGLEARAASLEEELKSVRAKRYKCFRTTQELYAAVDAYLSADVHKLAAVCTVYGPNIGFWDVSMLSDFSRVFDATRNKNCLHFNEDLSGWDTSRATAMQRMFYKAADFNQDLSSWFVSSVTDMTQMFYNCSKFDQDLTSWEISKQTMVFDMFYGALEFNKLMSPVKCD